MTFPFNNFTAVYDVEKNVGTFSGLFPVSSQGAGFQRPHMYSY
jgi:hypothetical protein